VNTVDERRLRRLLGVGRSLITELDPEAVFERCSMSPGT
jgi:hypothetical protein